MVLCSSIPGENGFNFGVQERCGKSIFCLILFLRLWRTYGLDKTTAPHRWRYIVCLLGRVVYAYDVGANVNHLYCMLKMAKFHN